MSLEISSKKLKQTLELIQKEYQLKVPTETRNSSHQALDLLILLILNQSTTDDLSDLAFRSFKKKFGSYQNILRKLSREQDFYRLQNEIKESIRICGLAKTKSFYILETLKTLEKENRLNSELDFINDLSNQEALRELTKLKGVGVKSASCLLMFSFQREILPIDTHLFRIFKRLKVILSEKISSQKAHKLIQPIVKKHNFLLHVALIKLGREICFSRKPKCQVCYLSKICEFNKNKPGF